MEVCLVVVAVTNSYVRLFSFCLLAIESIVVLVILTVDAWNMLSRIVLKNKNRVKLVCYINYSVRLQVEFLRLLPIEANL